MALPNSKPIEGELPNLSEFPPNNCFMVQESFRSADPMATALDSLLDEGQTAFARIELLLPLGCRFSLFLVRGYPPGEEYPAMIANLVVCREVATAMAANLDQGEVLEWQIDPRSR